MRRAVPSASPRLRKAKRANIYDARNLRYYERNDQLEGLHFAELTLAHEPYYENGNTVVVIEHNLDVIKCADYIIDLGPGASSRADLA